ncbi:hypothetical protein [Methylorubrum extorquens]|uniref:hypothetical protein n=1 Tax=Methylorubrum extorquens TaxID=408 RepID=UPI0020A1CEA8|nr:hypothetical protein [Methylorubrum extorquens]MCP1539361.1 hypothetical protein [Methylorubrum extorquens]
MKSNGILGIAVTNKKKRIAVNMLALDYNSYAICASVQALGMAALPLSEPEKLPYPYREDERIAELDDYLFSALKRHFLQGDEMNAGIYAHAVLMLKRSKFAVVDFSEENFSLEVFETDIEKEA